jgi:uncharacterized membrane protein
MGLYFKNKTNETVQVAISYPSSCPGGWAVKGWWKLAPGQEKKVWTGWAGAHRFYYYAESTSSGRQWSGDFWTTVYRDAFDKCEQEEVGYSSSSPSPGETSSERQVGMKEINPPSTSMDHTINLK